MNFIFEKEKLTLFDLLNEKTRLENELSLHACKNGKEVNFEKSEIKSIFQVNFDAEKNTLTIQAQLHNKSDSDIEFDDVYIDFPFDNIPLINVSVFEDTDDYFIIHPVYCSNGTFICITPYKQTQLELCENKGSIYRCYLYAKSKKSDENYKNVIWKNPSRSLLLKSNSKTNWDFAVKLCSNQKQITEFLAQYNRAPLSFDLGVNKMHMLNHYFPSGKVNLDIFTELANASHSAVLKNGRLASLHKTGGNIEVFDSRTPFGDVVLHTADGVVLDTSKETAFSSDKNYITFEKEKIALSFGFTLKGENLIYSLKIKNKGEKSAEIENLKLPFSVNNRMDWGDKAAEKMLRHSQVAGNNSFFLCTPCDGKAPYMLFMPGKETGLEFFDLKNDGPEYMGVYSAYIHAKAEARYAQTQEGGRWRLPVSSLTLKPGEEKSYAFIFKWVDSYKQARDELVKNGKIDIQTVPGLTVPREQTAKIMLKCIYNDIELSAEYPDKTEIRLISHKLNTFIYEIKFNRLGENLITIKYDGNKKAYLEMFSTLPVCELINRRSDYIRRCQINDSTKWYNGLLRERNVKTGALLDPDNYDEIKGWRIYEVTCDDPGLSKPAYLAVKNAEVPNREEIKALDEYIENFVWGGLQRTDKEDYPYAIYGIPDWYTLRRYKNLNALEMLHVWRVYDYPHIALMYLKMYEICKSNPDIPMKLTATEYLERAYGTYMAMYQYPNEIEQDYEWGGGLWSPYQTGFYNELAIDEAIDALRKEGMLIKARRLEYHWQHKARFFIKECKDLFGSEYAFDTTGFESTQAIVNWGRKTAAKLYSSQKAPKVPYTLSEVEAFDIKQRMCNIACRGYVENAYYLTGSDIRGDSTRYSLSYMSQMGGWALLQDALYSSDSPFELLRLAYTSLLSSWALLNAGDEESNYGYWFAGKENDGAASGGFEPSPYGQTWLGQNHQKGFWLYGCEIDLGYCGYMRGACIVLAEDPDFGEILYGGVWDKNSKEKVIIPTDGVARRFHIISDDENRLHIELKKAHIKNIHIENNGKINIYLRDVYENYGTADIFTHDGRTVNVNGSKTNKIQLSLKGLNKIEIETK